LALSDSVDYYCNSYI